MFLDPPALGPGRRKCGGAAGKAVAYRSMQDSITGHLAKLAEHRATIYVDVEEDRVLQIDVLEKTDVVSHPTLLDFSSVRRKDFDSVRAGPGFNEPDSSHRRIHAAARMTPMDSARRRTSSTLLVIT